MTERKYISEFGLHMMAEWRFVTQQDGLGFEGIDECHIYLIGRRPRITLVPESVVAEDGMISGTFLVHRPDGVVRRDFKTRNLLGREDLVVTAPYPGTSFEIRTSDGQLLANGKSALMFQRAIRDFEGDLDLEVLYVGQAYGTDGSRSARDRLKEHKTLQAIYSEALSRTPDQEVWLCLMTFQEIQIASFDGRHAEYGTTLEEDSEHIRRVNRTPISEQKKINFTEAALIRYFDPPFNVMFKDSFPSPAHKTYSECYDVDLNAVGIEIQTDDLNFRLWSRSVEPNWIHIHQFPLHSPQERRSMFEIVVPDAPDDGGGA